MLFCSIKDNNDNLLLYGSKKLYLHLDSLIFHLTLSGK